MAEDLYTRVTTGAMPVTPKEVKSWLRIDPDETVDDAVIEIAIASVSLACESLTGRDLRVNAYTLTRDDFTGPICILRSPVTAITSVKYTDEGSVLQTVAASVYRLILSTTYPVLELDVDQQWPDDLKAGPHRVVIEFSTGALEEKHAAAAKLAILNGIAWAYEHHGDVSGLSEGSANAVDWLSNSGARRLLDPLAIARVP